MKIVSTGATLASPGFLEKKQKARRQRRFIYGVALLLLLVGTIIASRFEQFRIREIAVVGADATPKDDVTRVAREFMGEKYFWLVPKDNALVYPEKSLKQILFRKFPRFNSIAFSLAGLQTLEITVTEREPAALYCGEDVTKCYFIDESGFIFDHAPTFSEGVYIVYSNEVLTTEPLGTEFLSAEEFRSLSNLVSKLPTLGLEPLSVEKRESDFVMTLKSGARVLWSREHDINRVSSNLESFLKSPAIQGEQNFLERVAELDLRTEDKVFYRFR